MKHLKIEYTTESGSKITLWDAEVAEVIWSDSAAGVRVEGKIQNGGGMNLLEMLTGGSKARTEAVVEEKRASLAAEKAAPKAKPVAKPRVRQIIVETDDDVEAVDLAADLDDID